MPSYSVGVKSVTLNEPHFAGHFPDRPIMSGVLQVETLAQLAGINCLQMEGAKSGAVFFFVGTRRTWRHTHDASGNQQMEFRIWNCLAVSLLPLSEIVSTSCHQLDSIISRCNRDSIHHLRGHPHDTLWWLRLSSNF